MKLNILDQSPVDSTPGKAIQNTLELAKQADKLGYFRYWVSEHHNTNSFASASPEILIPRIASITERIRVGSGGVLLPNYSPLKIAEMFNLLEVLFPGRIDLGVGRAGGADAETLRALHADLNSNNLFEKFDNLIAYLKNDRNSKPHPTVKAVPQSSSIPEIWVLGSSPDSAVYAAKKGLPYSFAAFINAEQMLQALSIYYQNFIPSSFLEKPKVNLGIVCLAAETDEDAERLIRNSEVWFVKALLRRENSIFPSDEETEKFEMLPHEKLIVRARRSSAIVGGRKKCAEKIRDLVKQLSVDELTLVTLTFNFEDRLNSYRIISEELLSPQHSK